MIGLGVLLYLGRGGEEDIGESESGVGHVYIKSVRC